MDLDKLLDMSNQDLPGLARLGEHFQGAERHPLMSYAQPELDKPRSDVT